MLELESQNTGCFHKVALLRESGPESFPTTHWFRLPFIGLESEESTDKESLTVQLSKSEAENARLKALHGIESEMIDHLNRCLMECAPFLHTHHWGWDAGIVERSKELAVKQLQLRAELEQITNTNK
jgi:hypothetical protein